MNVLTSKQSTREDDQTSLNVFIWHAFNQERTVRSKYAFGIFNIIKTEFYNVKGSIYIYIYIYTCKTNKPNKENEIRKSNMN